MVIADSNSRCRPGSRGYAFSGTAVIAGLLVPFVAGCACGGSKSCQPDQGRTQIQFFAPPGATVSVCEPFHKRPVSREVGVYGPYTGRLQHAPEEFAVFNLAPGHYEFKYTSAEGLPGANIYGELEVQYANSKAAQIFQRRAFVPIALPSEFYKRTEVTGNEMYPYRGDQFRTAIDAHDLERLKEGDVVEKVFVVADLKDAEKELKAAKVEIAALEREIEYAEARFRYAYMDFRFEADDSFAHIWGTDRKFISWEKKRLLLQQKLADQQTKLARASAILKGNTVPTRDGMLLVATEEVVKSNRDAESASSRIGEILVVMRLGGRHMKWGDAGQELAEYKP